MPVFWFKQCCCCCCCCLKRRFCCYLWWWKWWWWWSNKQKSLSAELNVADSASSIFRISLARSPVHSLTLSQTNHSSPAGKQDPLFELATFIGWRKSGSHVSNREEAPPRAADRSSHHYADCRMSKCLSQASEHTYCLNVDSNWICPKLATK